MRILCDIHHEELFESLRILFEDRLGHEVFRPIGMDWFFEGYWDMATHLGLSKRHSAAQQYLTPADNSIFRKLVLGERLVGDRLLEQHDEKLYLRYINLFDTDLGNGQFLTKSTIYKDRIYKAITLPAFKETCFDILISTVPEHIDGFNELIRLYQPQAKHIFQAGNPWVAPIYKVENILTSTTFTFTDKVNCMYYHQEFNTDIFNRCIDPLHLNRMFSMMHYVEDHDMFFELENQLKGWECKLFGAGCRDGLLGPKIDEIAEYFRDSALLWHVKPRGEGYGYNVHHAFATGTPVVVRRHHFRGQTIDPLLIDGETCIDLDGKSVNQIVDMCEDVRKNYTLWNERVYNRFLEVVDFDAEEKEIRKFIERLK